MNVLVITDALWRDDNGVGNSYSNIFNGIKDVKIANICLTGGKSKNDISTSCFQISEASLIRNIKNRKNPTGVVEDFSKEENNKNGNPTFFDKIKKCRFQIFFWLRNLIWKLGKWKSKELNAFIDDFKPDLIFAQMQDKVYLNNIVRYVQKYTKKPLFLYAWDDVYSLKQFSLSPLFWIDRFMQRRSIRKVVKQCEILYTISEEQRIEYAKTLKAKTKLLYKGYEFTEKDFDSKTVLKKPIEILYTGNLYSGRYKTVKKICKALDKINNENTLAKISVYSATPLSKKQIRKINLENTSRFMGKISEKEVQELQKKADVLLHIEPFTLKGSLLCRLSFSTKLVDYFHNAKCIFAVGHKRCSSMKYLKRQDAGIVVTSLKNVKEELYNLLSNFDKINEYEKKSYECGENRHQIKEIQKMLLEDFNNATNK